jgi:esterase/lipase superfamily enzyme
MIRLPRSISLCIAAGFLLLGGIGCQKKVYLMPTPVVMSTGEINPFEINPNREQTNTVEVFYATNRGPLGGSEKRTYTIFPSDHLRIGTARLNIGTQETPWEKLVELSTSDKKRGRPLLKLAEIREEAALPLDAESGDLSLPAESHAVFKAITQELASGIDKDLLVYVHGANSTIYRACAQAAQLKHFTGRDSTVLVFLWPSAENLLAYGTDVRHAEKSAPAFATLLRFLARHTRAEHIDILAYSAGSQIVSAGMAALAVEAAGDRRRQLRVGELYYAAADVGIDTFVEHLKQYRDIPRSTTLTINLNDTVLALAEGRHGVSRAGRPKARDLSEEALRWTRQASRENSLSIIAVDDRTVAGMSTGRTTSGTCTPGPAATSWCNSSLMPTLAPGG